MRVQPAISSLITLRLLTAAMFFFACETLVSAQGTVNGLVAPAEVTLYLHTDLKDTRFVQPLVCALQRVLRAPVSTQTSKLALGSELRATPTQFDVQKVADRFVRATAAEGTSPSFKYLIMPHDLKGEPWRYVFAMSFGNETTAYHLGIVSTARLQGGTTESVNPRAIDATATRAYKLILKSIARVAGLKSPDACILAFPRSLEELDSKSSEFCPNDRAVLVSAGILKSEEGAEGPGCIAISQAAPANQTARTALLERRTAYVSKTDQRVGRISEP